MKREITLSEIAQVNPRRAHSQLNDSDQVSFIPMSDVDDSGRWIGRQTRLLKEVKHGYTYFEEGDVLFAKITPCMENGKGCLAVGLKRGIGYGSTEFHVLRAKPNGDERFVFQWTISKELRRRAAAQMTGSAGQQRVPAEFLEQYPIPNLRKSEQSRIADVLTTIDRAIEQTEALIAKYRRIKTGLMHDLLTRGIDENGNLRNPAIHRFKASPVGSIPDEWELCSLGGLSKRITSGSRGWAKYYAEEGAKFIRIGNLTREHLNLLLDDIQHVEPPVGSEGKRTALETGDLLISITADLGIVGVVPEGLGEAYVNQHIALVRIDKERANPWWVGNFLAGHNAQQLFGTLNDAGAKAGLNLPTVARIFVPIPDMKEQNEIVRLLCQLDAVLNREKTCRAKLHRLKAGLVQDLLTGKVSVAPLLSSREEYSP